MTKVSSRPAFFKIAKHHLHLGWEAAALLAYVSEFEAQGKECFASRKHIAKELFISEATVHRLFQKLKLEGYLDIKHKNGKRWLTTIREGVHSEQGGVQIEQGGVFKMNRQGVQIEHIQRSLTKIRYTKNRICHDMYTCIHTETPDKPRQDFKDFWIGLSEAEQERYITEVADKLHPLKAKMVRGRGAGMMPLLEAAWKSAIEVETGDGV